MRDEHQLNFAKLDFFYSPSIEYSHRFLESLESVYDKLKDRILFEPHLVTFASKSQEFISKNCVSNGEYCAFDPNHEGKQTGRDVIMEGLRQKCIYKKGLSQYFAYMRGFYEKCFTVFTESCSKTIVDRLGFDWEQLRVCVDKSFHGPLKNLVQNENEILADDKEKMKKTTTSNFPNVFINNVLYRGSLSKLDMLLSICSSLHDEVHECQNVDLSPYAEVSIFQMVAFQLSVFLLGILVMAFVCKRIAKDKYKR